MEDKRMTILQTLRRQRITADKKLRYAPPKLPSATSFIREPLSEIEFEFYLGVAVGWLRHIYTHNLQLLEIVKLKNEE
jgi:hypothetical protein